MSEVEMALRTTLVGAGFTRRGRNFFRCGADLWQVVSLETSRWGPQGALRVGLALRTDAPPAGAHRCDVAFDAVAIVPAPVEVNWLLDPVAHVPERSERLQAYLLWFFLPYLARLSSEAGVRAVHVGEGLPSGLITARAREILGEVSAKRPVEE